MSSNRSSSNHEWQEQQEQRHKRPDPPCFHLHGVKRFVYEAVLFEAIVNEAADGDTGGRLNERNTRQQNLRR